MALQDPPAPGEKKTSCSHVWELSKNIACVGFRCVRCDEFRQVEVLRAFERELKPEIGESELIAFIRGIESGAVTLEPSQDPAQVREGPVLYRASNGWTMTVFKDRSRWDYLARIDSNDDRIVTFTTMPRAIRSYRPSRRVAIERYSFAGPMMVRQPDQRVSQAERSR